MLKLSSCSGHWEDEDDIEFAETTTCHGPRRFCNPKISIWRRTFWVVLVVGSMGLLCQQLYDRFSSFLQFEMKTSITQVTIRNMELPMVTLCNVNMFSWAHLTEMDVKLLDLAANMSWETERFAKRGNESDSGKYFDRDGQWETDYWNILPDYEKQEKEILTKYNVSNLAVDEWLKRTGWQLRHNKTRNYNAILQCLVGAQACLDLGLGVDFTPVLGPLGLCYSLRSHQSKPLYQSRAGVGAGINIMVDVDEENYSPYALDQDWTFGSGIMIYINEWYESPNYGATEVGVPTGAISYISLQRKERQIENRPPWGSCQSTENETTSKPYSRRDCRARCRYQETVNDCGCRLWYEPEHKNAKQCGVVRTSACLIFKALGADYSGNTCKLGCPDACTETTFEYGMSSTRLVSTNTLSNLKGKWQYLNSENGNKDVNESFFKDSLAMFQIGFEHLQVEIVRSTPSQSPSSFLSDLGGQLGLFAGISVVTICELLEYPLLKLSKYIKNARSDIHNKRHPQQERQQENLQSVYSIAQSNRTTGRNSL